MAATSRATPHPEQVRTIGRELQLDDRLRQGQRLGQRRPRGKGVVQHHDPVVVLTQLDFAGGEDHPVALDAAQLRHAERFVEAGKQRTRHRDGHGLARGDVGRATHDLLRLVTADVDPAQAQPVRVGVPSGLEHFAHAEPIEVAIRVRRAPPMDRLDLDPGIRQSLRQRLGRQPVIHQLGEP